jgi:hypothetical protein
MDRASKTPRILGRPTELLSENAGCLVRDEFGQSPPALSSGLTRFLALKVNTLSGHSVHFALANGNPCLLTPVYLER